MRSFFLLLAILCLLLGCRKEEEVPERLPADQEAKSLERRLLAPCCWRETLDVHSSPLATELRAEIRRRTAQGEAGGQIEADLVGRYGARIKAHLPESLGAWIAVLVCGVGGLLLYSLGRRRASPTPPASPSSGQDSPGRGPASRSASADQDYELQLDQDLLSD